MNDKIISNHDVEHKIFTELDINSLINVSEVSRYYNSKIKKMLKIFYKFYKMYGLYKKNMTFYDKLMLDYISEQQKILIYMVRGNMNYNEINIDLFHEFYIYYKAARGDFTISSNLKEDIIQNQYLIANIIDKGIDFDGYIWHYGMRFCVNEHTFGRLCLFGIENHIYETDNKIHGEYINTELFKKILIKNKMHVCYKIFKIFPNKTQELLHSNDNELFRELCMTNDIAAKTLFHLCSKCGTFGCR